MIRGLWLFVAFAGLMWLPLRAQPMRGPRPWWDSKVTADLNLSDAQTKQIRATVQEFRGRMFDLRAGVNKAESDLEAVFNEDAVDQRRANDAIEHLVAARGDLMRATSQMELRLRTLLTAQQWQELQKRQRAWPDRLSPRRRGPGPSSTSPTSQVNP